MFKELGSVAFLILIFLLSEEQCWTHDNSSSQVGRPRYIFKLSGPRISKMPTMSWVQFNKLDRSHSYSLLGRKELGLCDWESAPSILWIVSED